MPTAKPETFTVTVTVPGSVPVAGVAASHPVPDVIEAAVVKLMFCPDPLMATVWAAGAEPPTE